VPAVSNSSPLILFSAIGRLDVLRQAFDEIIVPTAVQDEVVSAGGDRPRRAEVAAAAWIRSQAVAAQDLVRLLVVELDRGEAETIALGEELGGGIPVLMDDRKGRRVAEARGLEVIGSAGVLTLAKQNGLIPLVRPVLDELLSAGLYLSPTAFRLLLSKVNEP
jgi:predicted nucleic acid-binding protein